MPLPDSCRFCTSVLTYMGNIPQPTFTSKQKISWSLQGPRLGQVAVSTSGQDVAELNVKDITVEPKLAPTET